jgi:hypothetical protein
MEQAVAPRHRGLLVALVAAVVANGVVRAPLSVPVLPVETYVRYAEWLGAAPSTEERKELGSLPQHYADMHGWDELVDSVAAAWSHVPRPERGTTRVLAQNYGEAAAVDLLGPSRGLPPAVSGHNNYWLWPPDTTVRHLLVIDGDLDDAREHCASAAVVGRTACGRCMPYEDDNPIVLCRGLRRDLAELWPTLKHFD